MEADHGITVLRDDLPEFNGCFAVFKCSPHVRIPFVPLQEVIGIKVDR